MRFRIPVFASLLLAMPFAGANAQFNRVYLDATTGRVGYHMSIGMLFPKDDIPAGNSGGPASGSCAVGAGRYSYSGVLPPGIKLETGGFPVFTGTPRQPGTWQGSLTFWVKCTGGPDQGDYVRTLPVTWQIEP